MPDTELVRLEGVRRRYRPDRAPVLDGVSFVLPRGAYVAIIGESGVGKSTLLNVIAGLEPVDEGRVLVAGTDLAGLGDAALADFRRRSLGFVFQAFHVLPYLSVADNVALPLALLGVAAGERATRVAAMLAVLGLAGAESRSPKELSGGELQRVAIARALVHRPALILADEPTGNLDPATAAQVQRALAGAVRAHGGGGLLITHSAAAAATADRIYRFDGRSLQPVTTD